MDQEVDFDSLPKKERKRLKRELERKELEKKSMTGNLAKWSVIIVVIILVALGGWWGYKELSKPLPGQQFENQGRDHVAKEVWDNYSYNSNPPTSGPHDEVWTKAGIFSEPQGDGHLVHSLEHGYVILNYNCGLQKVEQVGKVEQVEQEKEATGAGNSTASDTSNIESLSTEGCEELKKQLSDLANDKKLWKLIVVPRPSLESRIALTAWTWIEKMDGFDKERIVAFIDAHRNHGPEQTME